jgi:sulfate permease, SulP family
MSWLVFDAEAVTHVDSTGLEALRELVGDLRGERITLVGARLRTRMEADSYPAGLTEVVGTEHFYPTVRAAVAAYPEANRGVADGERALA